MGRGRTKIMPAQRFIENEVSSSSFKQGKKPVIRMG
jgi:hypothetical protein